MYDARSHLYQKRILCSITIFRKSSFHEMVWENVVEPERPQMAMFNGACTWRATYVLF